MTLGSNIKKFRILKGMKAYQLASAVGITTAYMSEIEKGKKIPLLPLAQKIAEAIGVSVSDLLGENQSIFKRDKLVELRGNRTYAEFAEQLQQKLNIPITALQLESYEKGQKDDEGNIKEPPKSVILQICKAEGQDPDYFYYLNSLNQELLDSDFFQYSSNSSLQRVLKKITENNLDLSKIEAFIDGMMAQKRS
ncbi:DNA-binding XRE family transcriptional regulator [Anaerobacterium chartisolvens]|uniref:DNA-binding XRE family transcriptional regulator n=1 Tax=Anaerobacterium chartisolvens TaxID=1297424 RepID=A0A369AM46_9FIRM|nr:helix-turn-helix transcriptional regulator [Anaerobacterium chartisolvens]RCX10450.1 DNA-binding XRE family transcriptional regulator [Anaerobacterium chartisolvens]